MIEPSKLAKKAIGRLNTTWNSVKKRRSVSSTGSYRSSCLVCQLDAYGQGEHVLLHVMRV